MIYTRICENFASVSPYFGTWLWGYNSVKHISLKDTENYLKKLSTIYWGSAPDPAGDTPDPVKDLQNLSEARRRRRLTSNSAETDLDRFRIRWRVWKFWSGLDSLPGDKDMTCLSLWPEK